VRIDQCDRVDENVEEDGCLSGEEGDAEAAGAQVVRPDFAGVGYDQWGESDVVLGGD
jgi:hypothetical protein